MPPSCSALGSEHGLEFPGLGGTGLPSPRRGVCECLQLPTDGVLYDLGFSAPLNFFWLHLTRTSRSLVLHNLPPPFQAIVCDLRQAVR